MKRSIKKAVAVILCTIMIAGIAPLDGIAELKIHLPFNIDFKLPDILNGFTPKASAEDVVKSGTCGDNLTWTLTADGTLTISGTGGMKNSGSLGLFPEWVGKPIKKVIIEDGVTSISEYAFYYCTDLVSVTIPDSVTSISEYAFYICTGLVSVTIPDSVDYIGRKAFYGVRNISYDAEKMTATGSPWGASFVNRYYENYILYDSSERKVIYDCGKDAEGEILIPASVTNILYNVFADHLGIESITVDTDNQSYMSDSYGVLYNKEKTELIQYPTGSTNTSYSVSAGVTKIDDYAFAGCTNLSNITVDTDNQNYMSDSYGVLFSKDGTKLIQYPVGSTVTSYNVPDSVTIIGGSAFYGCTGLTSITIPDSVTYIGGSAFYGCTGLANITIPDRVTSIGGYAFYGCTGLTSITIPDSVTRIGDSAFYGCTGLANIAIPDSVTSIGSEAFKNVVNICFDTEKMTATGAPWGAKHKNMYFEDPILYDSSEKKSIFYCAKNAGGEITISDSVTRIESSSFEGCKGITSITIPYSVTSIGSSAFNGCTGLKKVNYTGTVEQWSAINFSYASSNPTYYAKDLYINDELLTRAEIGGNISSISGYAFYNCTSLTSITISDSVKSIGDSAFLGCTNLINVSIPSSVNTIGNNAFSDVTTVWYSGSASGSPWGAKTVFTSGENYISYSDKTKSTIISCSPAIEGNIYITDSVVKIGENAFFGCIGITNIIIPDSVTSIENNAFSGCTNLTNITIPNSVTKIGHSAFSGCSNLTTVSIPKSVTSIENNAFSGCTGLTSICVDSQNQYYSNDDQGVLFNKDKTVLIQYPAGKTETSYSIPDSVTGIEKHAFSDCTNLTNITIPNSVTKIGYSAFSGCSNLTTVSIPKSVTSIEKYAFKDCSNADITIPHSGQDNDIIIESFAMENAKNVNCDYFIPGAPWGAQKWDNTEPCDLIYSDETNTQIIGYEGDSSFCVVPETVKYIGYNAFTNATNLKFISIPDSVKSIFTEAFLGCTNLEMISIGKGVEEIKRRAFNDCYKLKKLYINSETLSDFENLYSLFGVNDASRYMRFYMAGKESTGVEVVFGDDARWVPDYFLGTEPLLLASGEEGPNVTSITIGRKVSYIGKNSFAGCVYVKKILFNAENPKIELSSFQNVGKKAREKVELVFGEDVQFASASMFGNILTGKLYVRSVHFGRNISGIGSGFLYSSIGKLSISEYSVDESNKSFAAENGILFNKDKTVLIRYPSKKVGNHFTVPNTIKIIGDGAFYNCTGLTSITIPDNVTSIGENAFYGVNEILYNGSVEGAPWGAKSVNPYVEGVFLYYDNTKTTLLGCLPSAPANVVVPSSVEQVNTNCFAGCENIETITFNSDSIVFEEDAFSDCNNLETVSSPNTTSDGITYSYAVPSGAKKAPAVGTDVVYGRNRFGKPNGIQFCNRSKTGEYVVPDYVTYICDNAFFNCTDLSISIPDSVHLKRIGKDAFTNTVNYNNWNKESSSPFTIGRNLIKAASEITSYICSNIYTIADYAFSNCLNISEFVGTGVRNIGRRCFSGCSNLSSVDFDSGMVYCGEGVLEGTAFFDNTNNKVNGITYVGNTLICADSDITSCNIKEGTTCIAESAFSNCTQLTEINIPSTVSQIADKSFFCCINLNTVVIPEGVSSVGVKAFGDCRQLNSVSVPQTVELIDDYAFWGCLGLEQISVNEANEMYKDTDGVLFTKDGSALIQYPAGKFEDSQKYVIPEEVTYIESLAFRKCNNLTAISRPETAVLGLLNPFEGCLACFSTYVGDVETELTDTAYADNGTTIKSVSASVEGEYVVPKKVKHIGENAFSECIGITKITFEEGSQLELIDRNAFSDCTGITSIDIPASVTTIEESAFEGCLALTSVNFVLGENGKNETVVTIGDRAFANTGLSDKEDELKSQLPNVAFENDTFHICSYTVTNPASCTFDGLENCSCGKYKIVPAMGHKAGLPVKENVIPSTCKTQGSHDEVYYCERCKAKLETKHIEDELASHTPSEAVYEEITDPDDNTNITYDLVEYCSVCGTECTRIKDVPQGKPVKENEKAATCTDDGGYDLVIYTLDGLTELRRETIVVETLGHTPKTAIKENEISATCTKDGSYDGVVYCEVCKDEISRTKVTVPATGHSAGTVNRENAISATCYSEGGYDTVTYCRICGEVIASEHHTEARHNPTLTIINKASNDGKTLDYKTTVTFHARCDGVKSEDIHWFVDGKDMGTGSSYTVSNAEKGYTIEAKFFRNGSAATDDKGNPIKDSETIRIKNDIFSKIIAFFRMLFNALPKIDQK